MGSKHPRQYYCRCGTYLAKDNTERQCARCQRESRDKLIAPPEVPAEFWQIEQFAEAFAAQHMGRVSRVYRTHPYHYAVYGPHGISQTLLGEWLRLSQAQVSRFETGPPLQHLDTLRHWAQVMRIPAELLWFRMPDETRPLAVAEESGSGLVVYSSGGLVVPGASQTTGGQRLWRPTGQGDQHPDDAEHDPVLTAPWNQRGTVEVAMLLSSGGGRVKRRVFLALSGPALTAPAHQWLVHEPEALVSGLAGRRISMRLVDRFSSMVAELRQMDDVAGGGSVLAMAQQHFAWVAELLDQASYDEHTGQALHMVLAELGQVCGWSAYDSGEYGLAQRYCIAGLRAAHTADDRPLGAYILGSMAEQVARQGRPEDAVTLIETALAGSRGRHTSRLLGQLYNWQAWVFAALQDSSACTAAISRARAQTEHFHGGDDPAWVYWVNAADVVAGSGQCLLQLGQADRAAAMLAEGITLFDESFVRDRQIHLTYLTEALACPGKQRDLDAAAAKGIEAIQLAEGLDSTVSVERIRSLTRQLQPHEQVSAVREFLERAEGVGAGRSN
jgi:tetratricopeptide (TPR) repeat protein